MEGFTNNVPLELASPISAVTGTHTIYLAGAYAVLPTSGTFRLYNGTEIMVGTARTGNAVTVERAQEETDPVASPAGTIIICGITAGALEQLREDAGGAGLPWTVTDVATATPPADTTGTTDATTPFNDAITASGEYGWTYAPGTFNSEETLYKIAGTITLGGFGNQSLLSDIYASYTTPGTATAIDAFTNEPGNVFINGFVFDGPDGGITTGQIGIKSGAQAMVIEYCQLQQFDTGIRIYGGNASIGNCTINSGTTGIDLHSGTIPSVLYGNSFSGNVDASISVGSGGTTSAVIEGNVIGAQTGGVGILGVDAVGCFVAGNTYNVGSGAIGIQWQSSSYGNVVLDATSGSGTAIVDDNGGNFPSQVGPDSPVASGTTIAPVGRIEFVSGTTAIATITPPTNLLDATTPFWLVLIFEAACSFTTGGNISRTGSFVEGQLVRLLYVPSEEVWFW